MDIAAVSDLQWFHESVASLTVGWSEHIEYSVSINGKIEARAKTVRYPGLLYQLTRATDAAIVGPQQERGAPNKPASRPPGCMAPLDLIDTINEEAAALYVNLWWQVKGTEPRLTTKRGKALLLRNLGVLAEQAHEYPHLVRDMSRTSGSWVSRARVMLGYQRPYVMLASTVCGECGGGLTVAEDAGTDVRCVGTPDGSACGVVYRQHDWIAMLPALVTTDGAIAQIMELMGGNDTAYQRRMVRQRIYGWSNSGVLTRHGGTGNGDARWDPREIENAVRKALV